MKQKLSAVIGLLAVLSGTSVIEAAWKLECAPTKMDGVYAVGEPVVFRARLLRDGVPPAVSEGFKVGIYTTANNQFVTNAVDNAGKDVFSTLTLTTAGWCSVYAEAFGPNGEKLMDDQNKIDARCGAVVAPEALRQGTPEPADFDAYWVAERARILASPANAKFEKNKDPRLGGRDGYYYFSADLPGDFRGPTAMVHIPQEKDKKFPIFLFVHGTGVHVPHSPLWGHPIPWICKNEIKGPVIFCELNAHGYTLGQPDQFYKDLDKGELHNYQFKQSESDQAWYMKGLVLRLIRTIDELCKRPEWDRKNFIVYGASQGGAQALMAGGIDPRVNFVSAGVPAMCDFGGELVGHASGWPQPYFLKNGQYWRATSFVNRAKTSVRDDESCLTRYGYFDCVNFAARINPKARVELLTGGYDGGCPPTSVFAAYWRCASENKSMTFAPLGGHCKGDYSNGPLQKLAIWRNAKRVKQD